MVVTYPSSPLNSREDQHFYYMKKANNNWRNELTTFLAKLGVGVAGNRIHVPWGSFYTPNINWVSQSVKKKTEISKGEGSQMRRLMVKKPIEALRNWYISKLICLRGQFCPINATVLSYLNCNVWIYKIISFSREKLIIFMFP